MASTQTRSRSKPSSREAAVAAAASGKGSGSAKAQKGAEDPGYITVRAGLLPGKISEIALNGGRKVRDALEGAGLRADGYEIKVNTVKSTVDTDLKQDDTVLLVRKTMGNA